MGYLRELFDKSAASTEDSLIFGLSVITIYWLAPEVIKKNEVKYNQDVYVFKQIKGQGVPNVKCIYRDEFETAM